MPCLPTGLRDAVKTAGLKTALLLTAVLLTGCAGQVAFRDAQTLARQDRPEAALQKYREALAAEPANASYRSAYLSARDGATRRLVEQGDRALAEGKAALAQQAYSRVLAMDPAHERARAGMRLVEADARHVKMVEDARAAIERKEYELARTRLQAILTERPSHEQARLLLADVVALAATPERDTGLAQAYKQPISIEFRDAPLKQVFEVISRRSGLNFLFDRDVKSDARTSIFLKNSTVEAAVYYLLVTNQLEQQVMDGNTVLIYPNIAAKQREYQEMVVKTFFLANAEAKTVANTLKVILKSRDVVVDEKLNLIIVRDHPEAIKLATRLIALQDVAEPEVMLEVEILEIKRSRLLELGIAWPTKVGITPLVAGDAKVITIDALRGLSSSKLNLSNIGATINADKTDGDSNTLANPRIRVRNKEKAKVVIGEKVPSITTTVSAGTNGFAQESINYLDVGLTLNVEPTIYLNNEVAIRIALQVSNLIGTITSPTGSTAYQIGTREATTMLQLKDGENQVLAGLINNEDRSNGTKVPLLGDLPIVGRLFGSNLNENDKTEIVLSITPHLIRNIQRPAASAAEFNAGTEATFRRRPDAPVRPVSVSPATPPGGAPALPLSPPVQPTPTQPAPGQPAAAPAAAPAVPGQGEQPGVTVTPLPAPQFTPPQPVIPATPQPVVPPSPQPGVLPSNPPANQPALQ